MNDYDNALLLCVHQVYFITVTTNILEAIVIQRIRTNTLQVLFVIDKYVSSCGCCYFYSYLNITYGFIVFNILNITKL